MSGTAKKASLVVMLLLVLLTLPFPFVGATEDSWTTKAPMQQARGGLGVAVVDGKIYAIGGRTVSGVVGINEEYDPVLDSWSFKAPMPTPRDHFGIAVYQGKIYCIGGTIDDPGTAVTEVYDPATDTWETKAPMPAPRGGVEASVVNEKIYVMGGRYINTTEVYDPATDSWTTKAPLLHTMEMIRTWTCASAVVDNQIHVIGAFPLANSHQVYDSETNNWSFGSPVISSYIFAVAGATTGEYAPKRIYVYGTNTRYWDLGHPDFFGQSFDPITGNWTTCSAMPTGRFNAGVAVLNDAIYVIGGYVPLIGNNKALSAVNEQYIPVDYVPEFSSWILLPLFLSVTLVVVVLKKRLPQNACILGY